MQYQMTVTHAASGTRFVGDAVDGDMRDLADAKEQIKQILADSASLCSMVVGETILPGPFVVNQCYFSFAVL